MPTYIWSVEDELGSRASTAVLMFCFLCTEAHAVDNKQPSNEKREWLFVHRYLVDSFLRELNASGSE